MTMPIQWRTFAGKIRLKLAEAWDDRDLWVYVLRGGNGGMFQTKAEIHRDTRLFLMERNRRKARERAIKEGRPTPQDYDPLLAKAAARFGAGYTKDGEVIMVITPEVLAFLRDSSDDAV